MNLCRPRIQEDTELLNHIFIKTTVEFWMISGLAHKTNTVLGRHHLMMKGKLIFFLNIKMRQNIC